MAANEVKLTIRVGDDGSLDVVAKKSKQAAKETEKVGKATDKTRKSREKYNKGEKGVAGATSNSTKAFSKMRETMTGGGGLVPAYATLAANVFALSAAFGVLRRAAQVEQLTQGLAEMGRASGLAMGTLAKGMQEATKNALSLEEAMRATSMITSAGLDPSLVDDFGTAAQKAAVALGRNTQDALERFTRGVTKLEPELLDEIGLFVRVDEASEAYARTLGKNVSQLTNFEKRQAFANATLEQANEKFGNVNVDANPYDTLAAAFADLSKAGLNLLNNVLVPLITFVSGSSTALIGVMALFASTISKQLVGSLADYSDKAKNIADANKGLSKTTRENLNFFNRSSTTLSNLSDSLKDGTAATYEYDKAVDGQARSQRRNLTSLQKGVITQEEYTKRLKTNKKAINEIRGAEMRQRASSAALAESKAINALQAGRYGVALKNLRRSMLLYRGSLGAATKAQGFFTKSLRVGSVALKAFGTAARLAGAAFSLLLGPISLAIMAFSLLVEGFKAVRQQFISEETKLLEKRLESLKETSEELAANFKEIDSAVAGNSDKITSVTKTYIAYGNTLSTVVEKAQELAATDAPAAPKETAKFLQEQINNSQKLQKIFEETYGTTIIRELNGDLHNQLDITLELIKAQQAQSMAVRGIEEAFKNAEIASADYFTSLRPKTTVDSIGDALNEVVNSLSGNAGGVDIGAIIEENVNKSPSLKNLMEMTLIPEANPQALASLQTINDQIQEQEKIVRALQAAQTEYNKQKEYSASINTGITLEREGIALGRMRLQQSQIQVNIEADRKKAQKDQLIELRNIIDAERVRQITSKNAIALAKSELSEVQARNDISISGTKALVIAKRKVTDIQLADLEGQLKTNQSLLRTNLTEQTRADIKQLVLKLEQDIKTLTEQRVNELESIVMLEEANVGMIQAQQKGAKAMIDMQSRLNSEVKKELDARKSILESQLTLTNSRDPNRGYDPRITAGQARDIEKSLLPEKVQAEETAFNIRKQGIELEFALLEAQTKLLVAQLRLQAEQTKDPAFSKLANTIETDFLAPGGTLAKLKEATLSATEQQHKATMLAIGADYIKSVSKANQEGLSGTQSGSVQERGASFVGMLGEGAQSGTDAAPLSMLLQGIQNTVTPLMEDLKKLGPEGEVMASVAGGAMSIATAYQFAAEQIEASTGKASEGAVKTAATLQVISTAMSAMSNIMQASASANIAEIDKQIAAEKKRDGKSAQSVAKIDALEKKKDKAKRKAFEQQKKMQMGMVAINTAASIAANVAAASSAAAAAGPAAPGVFAGVLGMLNGITLALGAAQIAMIAGTSYQGGGSIGGGGSGGATSVSVGERSTSTDLARSQGGAGELAYFRGARGQGGPEDFRPAFAGYKNRAEGGNTAFMVGEQGPELFVPERPGRIVPNDDVQQGTPVNATINISAVDAAGVEDVLMNQRGNIISMIRDAANAQGDGFLENINVAEL